MNNPGHRHRFAVTELGPLADEVLRRNGEARIAAVFDRSFYIETAGSMACMVNATVEPGPLNASTSAPRGTNWRACGLGVGERVVLSGDSCRIGGRFVFELGGAKSWQPVAFPESWSMASLRVGLARLEALTEDIVPEDGLGRLAFRSGAGGADTLVLRRAVEPAKGLRAWLNLAVRDEDGLPDGGLDGIGALIGLGPGLTPSGDDFIGGVMIALHALGVRQAQQSLSTRVAASMAGRTTPISAVHLAAAMRGMGSATMHEMLCCLMRGEGTSLHGVLMAVDRIGHTSGWDCMAGMVTALRAWTCRMTATRQAVQPMRRSTVGQ